MIKKITAVFLCAVLIVTALFIGVFSAEGQGEEIPAELRADVYDFKLPNDSGITTLSQNVLMYCADTDTVLYHVNDNDMIEPGACVKLMVGALSLELYENRLEEYVEITEKLLEGVHGLSINLDIGEKVKVIDLIYAVMLMGANDAACVLSRIYSSDDDDFITLMNEKAKQIGAENTVYGNVTGFHESGMVTTLADTVKIAKYAAGVEGFTQITSSERYVIPATEKNAERTLVTRNCLLSRYRDTRYKTADVSGMCYGSTAEAGECLVASFSKNDMTYFLAVTGGYVTSDGDKRLSVYEDAVKLISHAENDFAFFKVTSIKKSCGEADIRFNSTENTVELVPTDNVSLYMPKSINPEKDFDFNIIVYEKYLDTPITEGQVVGRLDVSYEGDKLFSVPVAAGEDVGRNDILYFLNQIERITASTVFRASALSFVLLLALYGVFSALLGYVLKKKKRKRRLR